MKQKIILAGMQFENNPDFNEQFEETIGLAEACEFEVVGTLVQKRRSAHPATFFGEGKVEELRQLIEEKEAMLCMIASPISPSQMKTLKAMLNVEVMDRNDCILEIFARRAKTKEAKLQVELATLKHRLPYVIQTGQDFSRMGGGAGGMKSKGEGEKQLELDRRKIETQINHTSRALKEVKKNREVMRSQRRRSALGQVALVGYTNAGKSTCMNAMLELCDAQNEKQVFVKDMLFATLDTTVRKLTYKGTSFLLSDTVGFVSHLPHELIEAFHSTLEEVKEADLILLVLDETSEHKLNHLAVTQETLKKLEADQKEIIIVHNKCDGASFKSNEENHCYISAATKQGLDELMDMILAHLTREEVQLQCVIPYEKGELMALVHKHGKLMSCVHEEDGYHIEMQIHRDYQFYFKDVAI